MSDETYDLLDKAIMNKNNKTVQEIINYVLCNANDFIDMEDIMFMSQITEKQLKCDRTLLLFN